MVAKKAAKSAKKSVRKATTKVAERSTTKVAKKVATKATTKVAKKSAAKTVKPVLLSGGNPQIPKGYGEAPIKAYIAALSGWQQTRTRKIDALIKRAYPKVSKAVKWNSPLYGIEPDRFFVGIHIFAKYIKVAFFNGGELKPMPPGTSKVKNQRYLDVYEDDILDEAQFMDWIKQASKLEPAKM